MARHDAQIIQGQSEIDRLANKLISKLSKTDPSQRLVIGIAGVPGSGKTTLAALVSTRVNEMYRVGNPDVEPIAVAIPMDGFHYTRAHLAAMPNATGAIHRRGVAAN